MLAAKVVANAGFEAKRLFWPALPPFSVPPPRPSGAVMRGLFGDVVEMPVRKTASISDCGTYRFRLTRNWGPGYMLPFVMLNPSTADAEVDDPTIRRCMSFARREDAGGITVVNLFAYRTPSPAALWKVDPLKRIGLHNEHALYDVANEAIGANMPVVCAWGAGAGDTAGFTTEWLKTRGARLVCLGTTKDGHPRHPLYVKGDQPLEPFPSPSRGQGA